MATGLDPEWVYRRLFATAPLRRLQLLREALGTLRTADDAPVGWMTVTHDAVLRHGATPEDFEGLVEHVRSVEGIEVALIFRETSPGETKVSFRSNGEVDVNRIARGFGGGGHVKAAGASISGPVDDVARRVVDAVRAAIHAV
jgi:phosphoesterase RecJ-like protein